MARIREANPMKPQSILKALRRMKRVSKRQARKNSKIRIAGYEKFLQIARENQLKQIALQAKIDAEEAIEAAKKAPKNPSKAPLKAPKVPAKVKTPVTPEVAPKAP